MENRNLVYNGIRTPDGTVLVSYHRHDYKTYTDKNGEEYVIDGGDDYIRTSLNKEAAESLAVYDDEPFEKVRDYIHRGSRGKNGDQPLTYIKLSDIDDEYLHSLIQYEEDNRPNNPQLNYYKQELAYRTKQ